MGMREGPVCHEMSKYLSEPAANERRLGTAQPCCCEPSLPALSYMLIFYGFPCDIAYLPWQAQLAMGLCRGLLLPEMAHSPCLLVHWPSQVVEGESLLAKRG